MGSASAFVYLRARAAVVSEATVWVIEPGRVGTMPACCRPRALRGSKQPRSSGDPREATAGERFVARRDRSTWTRELSAEVQHTGQALGVQGGRESQPRKAGAPPTAALQVRRGRPRTLETLEGLAAGKCTWGLL